MLENLFLNFKGRHRVSEKRIPLPDKYVLLLLGEGWSGSFCLKNTKEYWTRGKGWGNDFEVIGKVEQCVQEKLPDSKLLVRQHPYTKYKFDKQHINPKLSMLVNDVELDSLINNAYIIITTAGSILYYSLAKGKRPIVLGDGELCNTRTVKCVDSVEQLKTCFFEISSNKEILQIGREEVVEAVMPYFKNQIWVNGEQFTHRVLDKYINDRKLMQDNPLIWKADKKRILKYLIFISVKNKLSAVCSRIKRQLKNFRGLKSAGLKRINC